MTKSSNLLLRQLELGDFEKGYMNLLGQLTSVGDVTFEKFRDRYEFISKHPEIFKIAVIEDLDEEKIIGSAALIIEAKFIHDCGKASQSTFVLVPAPVVYNYLTSDPHKQVGHIEDVVVNSNYRGQRLGFQVVEQCIKWSKDEGCYKIILDCM